MLWDEPKIFFLERRYFFSIILSEFLKNRVALHLSFFRIVLCVVRIPKKYLGNRPSDFGSANDNGGQKAEQSNNSIQNIHDGVPPSSLSCIND